MQVWMWRTGGVDSFEDLSSCPSIHSHSLYLFYVLGAWPVWMTWDPLLLASDGLELLRLGDPRESEEWGSGIYSLGSPLWCLLQTSGNSTKTFILAYSYLLWFPVTLLSYYSLRDIGNHRTLWPAFSLLVSLYFLWHHSLFIKLFSEFASLC